MEKWMVLKTQPNGDKEIIERGMTREQAERFAEDCNVFARHERRIKRAVYTAAVEN